MNTNVSETPVHAVMSHEPARIESDANVATAMTLMEGTRETHVLIIRDGKLAGLLSERELLAWLPPPIINDAARAYQGQLARTGVTLLMTSNPIAIAPETPIGDALNMMVEHGLTALPVIDAGGAPVGLLTLQNLAVGLLAHHASA